MASTGIPEEPKVFSNYEEWQDRTKVPLAKKSDRCKYQRGLLPGDFSASIEINGVRVGVVGLNSTFLQLRSGNFEGRLEINKSQVDKACDGDLHKWVKENHINILMTHQPLAWLSQDAQKHFKANILDRDNFTFHIYGHMHEGNSEEVSIAGSQTHREIQGASLFGYEEWVNNNEQHLQRIHRYNAISVDINDGKNAKVKIWPRLLVTTRRGYQKLVADYNFDLEEDFYTMRVPIRTYIPIIENVIASKGEALGIEKIEVLSEEKKKKIISIDAVQGKLDIYTESLEVSIILYVEGAVNVVIPRHKSFMSIEFPDALMEKIPVKCYFKQVGEESFVRVNNKSEVHITGNGSFEVYGSIDKPVMDKVVDGGGRVLPEVKEVLVQISLWLGQSKSLKVVDVKIPLHKCGHFHFD